MSGIKEHVQRLRRQVQRLIKRLGPTAVLAGLWLVIPAATALWMVASLGWLSDLLVALPQRGVLIWTPLIGVAVGLGLLAIYANTILCGWVFGWGGGFLSAMVSYVMGLCLGYLISRRVSLATVHTLIEEHEPAALLKQALLHSSPRRAWLVVTLFRLAGFPFPFGTLVLTSLGVPLPRQIIAAIIGLLPRVGTATFIAASAARTGARDIQSLVRGSDRPIELLLGAALSLCVIAGLGAIARRAMHRIAMQSAQGPEQGVDPGHDPQPDQPDPSAAQGPKASRP